MSLKFGNLFSFRAIISKVSYNPAQTAAEYYWFLRQIQLWRSLAFR